MRKLGVRWWTLTEADEEILKLCDHTFQISGGLNDPTSLPLTSLWDRAGKEDRMPSSEEIEEAKNLISWPAVEWGDGKAFLPEKGMALEIGGFGKEYAVDRLIGFAKRLGIVDCLGRSGARCVSAWATTNWTGLGSWDRGCKRGRRGGVSLGSERQRFWRPQGMDGGIG